MEIFVVALLLAIVFGVIGLTTGVKLLLVLALAVLLLGAVSSGWRRR
jgi:hypothetical protein